MAMYVREDAQVEALSTISAASYVQAMYRGHLGRVTYRFQATVNVLDVNLEETSEVDPHALVPTLCPFPLSPSPFVPFPFPLLPFSFSLSPFPFPLSPFPFPLPHPLILDTQHSVQPNP